MALREIAGVPDGFDAAGEGVLGGKSGSQCGGSDRYTQEPQGALLAPPGCSALVVWVAVGAFRRPLRVACANLCYTHPVNRNRQLNIRVSEEEVDRLEDLAEHYGISTSAVLRMLVKRESDMVERLGTSPDFVSRLFANMMTSDRPKPRKHKRATRSLGTSDASKRREGSVA